MSKIIGVVIDVINTHKAMIQTVDKANGIQDYYDLLNCSLFDIACRKIGENYYDIYCDDEGLLKCNPIVSAVSSDGEPMLVGNLFVAKTNDEGETISLNEDELSEVLENVTPLFDVRNQIWYKGLICDY